MNNIFNCNIISNIKPIDKLIKENGNINYIKIYKNFINQINLLLIIISVFKKQTILNNKLFLNEAFIIVLIYI